MSRHAAAPITPTKDAADPQPTAIMERAIVDVAEGARKMLGGRLNQRAIAVLLKDATGVPMETINRVLDSAARLDRTYLKAAVLFVAVAGLTACAGARPRPAACQNTPQWTATDSKGAPASVIYVCFADDGTLLWKAQKLTPEESAKLVALAHKPESVQLPAAVPSKVKKTNTAPAAPPVAPAPKKHIRPALDRAAREEAQ